MNRDSYDKIRQLIGEDKTLEALTLLEKHYYFFDDDIYNEILLNKSRYQRLNKEKIIGSIDNDDFSRRSNQINDAILSIIKPKPNSIFTITDSIGNSKNKVKKIYTTKSVIL